MLKVLNDLYMDNIIYIVVIDVVDECIEYGSLNIFNLFWKWLFEFFKNMKFFIILRNIFDIRIVCM